MSDQTSSAKPDVYILDDTYSIKVYLHGELPAFEILVDGEVIFGNTPTSRHTARIVLDAMKLVRAHRANGANGLRLKWDAIIKQHKQKMDKQALV